MAENLFIPPDPKNVVLRPLNKGMYRDIPANVLPEGAVFTAKNLLVKRGGLMKRPGLTDWSGGNQVNSSDQPVFGIAPLWKTTGAQIAVLLTSRYLYQVTAYSAPTPYYYEEDGGANTCSTSGATVTGVGTDWEDNDIYSTATGAQSHGDYFVLDADGSGDGPEIIEILQINSDTELVLASTPAGTYGAGTDWKIYKRFHVPRDMITDWTVADNTLIMTDYTRTPYSFDGTTFTEYDSGITYVCGCLCHMSSRLWMANTIESGTYYRQRVRWSSATDRTSFSAADYYDIPYTSGKISRLVPLGDQLVAYFDDAVYFGRPTNYTDLPKAFYQIETAGIGLIGPRAVCSFFNGHAFVGQDDIYYIDKAGQCQKFGSPVVSETIAKCSKPSKIYAAFDPNNERLAFGFPETGNQILKIWSYNYKVKAWSYDEVECTSLSNPLLGLSLTYADLTDAGVLTDNTYTGWGDIFPTYGSTQSNVSLRDLFVTNNGYTYIYSEAGGDDDGVPVEVVLETGDLDFGIPDTDKTATKLSVRLGERPTQDILFAVWGSVDGGNTWDVFGNLTITDGQLEDKVDFQITGAAIRFRLTSTSAAGAYTIADVVLRIASRGIQYDLT
jgi:hypothetical protein